MKLNTFHKIRRYRASWKNTNEMWPVWLWSKCTIWVLAELEEADGDNELTCMYLKCSRGIMSQKITDINITNTYF